MQDIKEFEPLWGEWYSIEMLGQGAFGKVYKMVKRDLDKKYYAAVKHLSFPSGPGEVKGLFDEGIVTNDGTLKAYYDDVLKTLRSEIDLCYKLKGNTNIVSYEDHYIRPKDSGVGYDIFIKMELLTGLQDRIREGGLTVMDVVKLGEDMCRALTVLCRQKIVHRDIKPGNIFINSGGNYKLGDFGVSRIMERIASNMSVKGTYSYMAPEVAKGWEGDYRVDIYSLGLVLYRMLNKNRGPFLPLPPQIAMHELNMTAQERRLQGEPLPSPTDADGKLAEIILKACAYRTEDRWNSAAEMGLALAEYKASASSKQLGLVVANIKLESSTTEFLNASLDPELTETPKSGAVQKNSSALDYGEETQILIPNTEDNTQITQKHMTQTRREKLLKNLGKWIVQTVLLSILPMFFYFLIHWMFQLEEDPARRYLSELCSFTLVISSSIAMELSQKKYNLYSVRSIIFPAYFALQAIFFVTYGIIYCALELDLQLSPVILNNMFLIIWIISGIYFIISFLLQVLEVFYGE